jgi:hypothetical protein
MFNQNETWRQDPEKLASFITIAYGANTEAEYVELTESADILAKDYSQAVSKNLSYDSSCGEELHKKVETFLKDSLNGLASNRILVMSRCSAIIKDIPGDELEHIEDFCKSWGQTTNVDVSYGLRFIGFSLSRSSTH